jgi:uncharacterized membrane protein YkgB
MRDAYIYIAFFHIHTLTNPDQSELSMKSLTAVPSQPFTSSTALLRWSLVIVFLWFGGMKFTGYEAQGIAPFIAHSPIMSWLHTAFGVSGASALIGVVELGAAVTLAIGAWNRKVSILGALLACATYGITLTFLFTTPGVAEPLAGGFPAISAPIGQFLLKDAVLLAASLVLLRSGLAERK